MEAEPSARVSMPLEIEAVAAYPVQASERGVEFFAQGVWLTGSILFILAVTIRLYITAARSPPRSEPQNSQDLRPKAMPRTPRSAALFDRQMRPSSRKRVNTVQRLSI